MKKHASSKFGPEEEPGPSISKMPTSGRSFILIVIIIGAILVLAFLYEAGYVFGKQVEDGDPLAKGLVSLSIIIILWLLYLIPSRTFSAAAKRHPERQGDIIMIKGLVRAIFLFVGTFGILSVIFDVGALLAVIGAFAGMFLGWSLQSPVSGFVAYILVTVKRPFKVGDRVLFPSWNLIGDVLDVGAMYTRLNQVGGTVGSEDKSNREILIPNAQLWGHVIINYTSSFHLGGEEGESTSSRFVLDEVVARVTFDSDWEQVETILINAAKKVTADIIEETGNDPYVRSDMYDYGIYMRLRFMTVPTDRPRISYEITKRIVKGFQKSEKVDFAIPWVYSYRKALGQKDLPNLQEDPSL